MTTQRLLRPLANILSGQMLAIAFSNSSVSLINAQTGKVVHEISHQEKADIKICCLGWGLNSTDAKGTKFRSDNLDIKANFDDAIPTTFGTNPVDLPNDLAFLDIGGLLSRLSALPPGNREWVVSQSVQKTIIPNS